MHLHFTSSHQSAHFITLLLRMEKNKRTKSSLSASITTDSYGMGQWLLSKHCCRARIPLRSWFQTWGIFSQITFSPANIHLWLYSGKNFGTDHVDSSLFLVPRDVCTALCGTHTFVARWWVLLLCQWGTFTEPHGGHFGRCYWLTEWADRAFLPQGKLNSSG